MSDEKLEWLLDYAKRQDFDYGLVEHLRRETLGYLHAPGHDSLPDLVTRRGSGLGNKFDLSERVDPTHPQSPESQKGSSGDVMSLLWWQDEAQIIALDREEDGDESG